MSDTGRGTVRLPLPVAPLRVPLIPDEASARAADYWLPGALEPIRNVLVALLGTDTLAFETPSHGLLRSVLARQLPRVTIRASGVTFGRRRLRVAELDVVLEDVRLRATWRGPTVTVGAARFRARLLQPDLDALVTLPQLIRRLSVVPGGVVFHTVMGIPVQATVAMADDRIVVTPFAPAGLSLLSRVQLSIDVPPLPAGARIEQLHLRAGEVVASGPLDPDQLTG